ncbi:hypothetical protein ACHAXT_000977 [Thalassiosira profunda]
MESPSLLPRHHTPARATPISSERRKRLRRRPPSARSKPPSQDHLVVIFVAASAMFALISVAPFLLGHFPSHGIDDTEWMHKHGDGQGGVLDLAGNKTLLAWHYLVGQRGHAAMQQKSDTIQHDASPTAETLPLDRGVSGLPLSKTPALIGAKHGSISCPSADGNAIYRDELAYWNEPQGASDISFVSPFAPTDSSDQRRYVTFEPDRGGWNNIRMSLEIVIVFAAATGRTLVLPPDTPFYLISKTFEGKRQKGFADFLDLDDSEALRKKVKMITMTEFLALEGDGKMFAIPKGSPGQKIRKSAEQCYYVAKSDRPCDSIYGFLRGEAYVPELQAGRDCLIFDADRMSAKEEYSDSEIFDLLPESQQQKVKAFCDRRNPIFFGSELASAPLVHFHAGEKHHRLLNHFYTFLYFADVKVDHHYKRFVRDFLHYTDKIWCAAGRVLDALEAEATKLAGKPGFSALHVRRGDFQYKKVKITAEDWYTATKELFLPNEIVYIATDETNRTFFEPLARQYNLRYLNDFTESAGLKDFDPNLLGMIDSIVASRGRVFVGTWFSTFSGYINRLRGYYGMRGASSYYSTPDRKFNTHKWEDASKVLTAREWPTAWVGIDGDEVVTEERKMIEISTTNHE